MPAQPSGKIESGFRVRIAPSWEAIVAQVRKRTEALGLPWPKALRPARYPRVYSMTVAAQPTPPLRVQVMVWEPPREYIATPEPISMTELKVSFGLASKRTFTEVQPGFPLEAVTLWLDHQGLFLAPATNTSGETQPAWHLQHIPLATVVDVFSAVGAGTAPLVPAGTDHIVDKFASPQGLEDFRVSRWRGDKSYRLSTPLVQLEVWTG